MKKLLLVNIFVKSLSIVVICFLFSTELLSAKEIPNITNDPGKIHFETISNSKGLSQVTVLSICQDHFGYLWVGTREGLNKYDGYNFTYFKNMPDNKHSISSDFISAIYEDKENRLWVGTDNGLNYYDRENNYFNRYHINNGSQNLSQSNFIKCIYRKNKDELWVGSNNGLFSFVDSLKKFKRLKLTDSHRNNIVISFIKKINQQRLFLGTNIGLFEFSNNHFKRISTELNSSSQKGVADEYINDIVWNEESHFWVGTNKTLIHMDQDLRIIEKYNTTVSSALILSNNRIKSLSFDDKKNLWIGTEKGLSIIDENLDRVVNFISEKPNYVNLSNDEINCIYRDINQVLWVGTNSGGLNKFSWAQLRFSSIEAGKRDGKHLSNKDVYAIFEDLNHIFWFGTNRGLNRYDPNSKQFKYYFFEEIHTGSIGKIRSIVDARGGNLWLGTYGGLILFHPQTGKYRKITISVKGKIRHSQLIASLINTSSNILWVGTSDQGLYSYNIVENKFIEFRHDPKDSSTLSSNNIRTMILNDDGNIWVGTYGGGLDFFNTRTKKFTHNKNIPGNPLSLSSDFVYSIYKNSPDELWIGTYGGGVNRFDLKNKTFEHFMMEDGLPNEVVYGIVGDGQGCLWMSTNNGLSRLNTKYLNIQGEREKRAFRNYDSFDGLLSNEFNFGAYYKNHSDILFFGNTGGLNYFQPDDFFDSNKLPSVEITGVTLYSDDDESSFHTIKNVSRADKISFSYHTYFFTINFSALDFNNPNKNRYAYMLEGLDPDWIYPEEGLHQANYTSVGGGNYRFKVKASNSDGIWNESPRVLEIAIRPPVWLTWWFKTLFGLLIFLFAFLFHRFRLAGIKKYNLALASVNTSLKEQIDERKKAEAALFISEEKYRTITNNLRIGIYRSDIKEDGRLIEVNPAFLELLGYQNKAEVLEKEIKEFYQDPGERKKLVKRIIQNRFIRDEEIYLIKKDGQPIICSNTSVVVSDEDGNPLYLDGILEDITEKKRIEQALKESEEKYRNFVERALDGIIIVQDSVLKFVNKRCAEILKTTVKDLLEKPFIDYIHPNERDKVNDMYLRRISGEDVELLYQSVLIDMEGKEVNVEINAGLISYGKQAADLVFIRDITERLNLENQLRQIQKMEAIGLLAGGVAHDFNNILTIINGNAELALNEVNPQNSIYRLIQEIHKSGERAANLTRQLLAFSRRQIIKPRVLNINSVIANMDKMLGRLIGEDIVIKLILSPEVKDINADPGQIEQIMMNLVINARDAILSEKNSKKPKLIIVETNYGGMSKKLANELRIIDPKKYIKISVTDTGVGIDKEIHTNIFDPFFTTKETGKGTGLGLSTVFGIVKQNGGEIKVDSASGRGSTFTIFWPIEDNKKIEILDPEVEKRDIGGEEKILLVEDDPGVRSFARMALQQSGYLVLEADNGKEAIKLIEKDKPKIDFLITDIIMPEMNGHELAEIVKREYPDIFVLFTSGHTDRHIVHQSALNEGVSFLQKPYSATQLNTKVREILDEQNGSA